ncbi:hypothetical protein [Aeromicrobium duanguangcaii]|uniref:hypothetical protein n=1 Tax=Aeromicrobium duanguangcaii TaxID=2968086 RepID=UPI002017DCEA|nr:hypothetical protein [Aeromicrobium duanguangcaii]MCL3836883.1 hypothetical protein [Aeromicrobium duanguangcaii]
MDVLLVDDKEGEGALLDRVWQNEDVRVWQVRDLSELLSVTRGRPLRSGAMVPESLDAVIIDLDLGHAADGAAGGLQSINAIRQWQESHIRKWPIVLRTQDVDDDRSLSAVLAAELLDEPLALWGKRPQDAVNLLSFLRSAPVAPVHVESFGGALVHPVRILKEERGEQLLGEFLFGGRRAVVWERIYEGFDADVAVLAAGYARRNKFWDQVNALFSAIVFLRDLDDHLHKLNGTPLRLTDIERRIAADELVEVDLAINEVQRGLQDSRPEVKERVLQVLRDRRGELDDWINERRTKKPSFNRNFDQGEFIGAFGKVLGNPEVLALFVRR